jgi:hypothetical protein
MLPAARPPAAAPHRRTARRCCRGAQAEFVLDLLRCEAARAALDQEAAHAIRRRAHTIAEIGDVAVGDPHLRAVEYPAVAVAARGGAHVGRIRAALRLGQAEAADDFAARHARQPLLFLLLRCRRQQSGTCTGSTAPTRSCAARCRRAPVRGRSAVADRVQAGAAVALDASSREDPVRRSRAAAPWESGRLEAFADDRQHALVDHACDRIAYQRSSSVSSASSRRKSSAFSLGAAVFGAVWSAMNSCWAAQFPIESVDDARMRTDERSHMGG